MINIQTHDDYVVLSDFVWCVYTLWSWRFVIPTKDDNWFDRQWKMFPIIPSFVPHRKFSSYFTVH